MLRRIWYVLGCLSAVLPLFAQDEGGPGTSPGGRLTGNLSMNGNFFMRDARIGAANTPQYDRQLFGADSWLNLNYQQWGFDLGLRFDLFNNSNLLNPTGSFTGVGIGQWYVSKRIHKLGISGGYLYDIIGSGIIFRAYEQRPLAIDQALYGVRLTYDILPDWKVKAFTGRQKQQFDVYNSVLRGLNLEGFLALDSAGVTLAPGIGVVGRTLDDPTMNNLVAALNTYRQEDIARMFPDTVAGGYRGPAYNTYAATFYNTLTVGPFSWYVETAWKSKDIMNDPFADRVNLAGDTLPNAGAYVNTTGSVLFTSLSYAHKGLGITLEGKRTDHFDFRTRPQEEGFRGLLHYIPPMARVNTYRLPARYAAATQFVGEMAIQADIRYRVNKKLSLNLNLSHIDNLDKELLYREIFSEIYFKQKNKWSLTTGLQWQRYNQEVFYGKPEADLIETLTPYLDFLYHFDRRKTLRLEAQYMNVGKNADKTTGTLVREDYGNWIFALLEFSAAPYWTVTVSDMYNIDPGKISPVDDNGKKLRIHYPRVDLFYTYKANRLSLSYVKQVEGIVCSGGICRLEPAFSGVKMSVNSTF